MNRFWINKSILVLALSPFILSGTGANALTVDWSGHFRADHNFIHDYQMNMAAPGSSYDPNAGGEYIRGEGKKTTTYSTVFMKLKPKVLVNDNVIIRSEWNVGDPVSGIFGRSIPSEDRNNALSTGKGSLPLTVARLWLDTHTDFGTLQVGRAPMHWGLGIIFNAGDKVTDHYQSTSDTIRLVSKFGYFSLMPLYAKNATGQNIAGARNPITGARMSGSDDVTDYGLSLKYENPEEDLEGGAMYYKRNANDAQTSYYSNGSSTYVAGANGMNLKLFDFYARKSWRKFELAAEVPIYMGEINDVNGISQRNDFKATAIAAEAAFKLETWKHTLKFGTVPGQAPAPSTAHGKTFSALYFHRNYKLGQILFNYNLGNFGLGNPDAVPRALNDSSANSANTALSPDGVVSPYDSAITNAKYVMLSSEKHWEQWGLNFGLVYAMANQSAQIGYDYYNSRTKQWSGSNAVSSQGKNLGLEFDFGTRYNWDENISFGADMGLFFPGNYFKFINKAGEESPTNRVSAFSFSAATTF